MPRPYGWHLLESFLPGTEPYVRAYGQVPVPAPVVYPDANGEERGQARGPAHRRELKGQNNRRGEACLALVGVAHP